MRQKRFIIHVMLLCLMTIWLFSCGSGGGESGFNEVPYRFSVNLTPQDNDEDTPDIDVVQVMCDNETEDFTDFTSKIEITADSNTASLIVESYRVTFTPVRGVVITEVDPVTGQIITVDNVTPPPSLPSPLNGIKRDFTQPKILSNGTLTIDGVVIWPAVVKHYYVYNFLKDQQGYSAIVTGASPTIQAETTSFEYDYKIVLYCKTSEDVEIELEAYGTVVFANYNNC